MNRDNTINRFLKAQQTSYQKALSEIKNGEKETHWMWFVFPQIKGLGHSAKAEYYGIDGIREAKEYISNELLYARLIEISEALLLHAGRDIEDIMGYPDDLKLCSSMTLFSECCPDNPVFTKVLDIFFEGNKDKKTLEILHTNDEEINRP